MLGCDENGMAPSVSENSRERESKSSGTTGFVRATDVASAAGDGAEGRREESECDVSPLPEACGSTGALAATRVRGLPWLRGIGERSHVTRLLKQRSHTPVCALLSKISSHLYSKKTVSLVSMRNRRRDSRLASCAGDGRWHSPYEIVHCRAAFRAKKTEAKDEGGEEEEAD
jgi:hypothetical protein